MRKCVKKQNQFSLIEILVAIFILALGMIGLASLFSIGAQNTRKSVETTVAASVAKNALVGLEGGRICDIDISNDPVWMTESFNVPDDLIDIPPQYLAVEGKAVVSCQSHSYGWKAYLKRDEGKWSVDLMVWNIQSEKEISHWKYGIFEYTMRR